MAEVATVLALFELFIGLVAIAGSVIAWTYRNRPAGRPLFALFVAGGGYSLASGLNVLVSDPLLQHLIHNLTYPFGIGVAAAVLLLSIEFTRQWYYRRRALVIALSAFIIVDFALAMTDPIHNLYITERVITAEGGFSRTAENTGVLFWVRSLFAFLIASVGLGVMLAGFSSNRGIYRKQSTIVIVAYVIGLGSFLVQTFAPVHAAFDVATIGLLVGASLILWALFYAGFLEIVPIAQATLMDSIDEAVLALDSEDRLIELNHRAQTVLGIDEEALGTRLDRVDTVGFDLAERVRDAAENGNKTTFETDSGGVMTHYRLRLAPIADRPGGTGQLGRLVLIGDVTEEKTRELTLERQNARLDRFADVISHDLRNPLHTAGGYAHLAEETGDSDAFERIHTAHEQMSTMIEQLLALSRRDLDTDLEPVDFPARVRETWDTLHLSDLELSIDVPPGTVLKADQTALHHIFANLFENAAAHNERPVTVTVGLVFDGGAPTGFFIGDDGTGISNGATEEAFEHGYTTESIGHGLGLAIVREYAEDLGWTVRVTDNSDGGARFEFLDVEIDLG